MDSHADGIALSGAVMSAFASSELPLAEIPKSSGMSSPATHLANNEHGVIPCLQLVSWQSGPIRKGDLHDHLIPTGI
jgi:hypothetical protein